MQWEREIPRSDYQGQPPGLSPHKAARRSRSRKRRWRFRDLLVSSEAIQIGEIVVARPDAAGPNLIVVCGGSPQVSELGIAEIISSLDKAGLYALDDVLALRKGDGVLRHGLKDAHHTLQFW
jgi:hypothetical protein